MKSTLEQLYHGNLFPNEKIVSKDPDYLLLNRRISDSLESWRKKLSPEEFDELEALVELCHQVQGMDMTASFIHGFKMGASIMNEVFTAAE